MAIAVTTSTPAVAGELANEVFNFHLVRNPGLNPAFPDFLPNARGRTTNPVQLYHLGLWFNDPKDAVKAGGPSTVTPFNGEHNAGVQILDTSNFPDDFGPLRHLNQTFLGRA